MATYKEPWSSLTTLTTSALNSLASATYVSAGTIDVSATDPLDIVVQVEATPGTVSSNKQLVVFLKVSMDGTDYSTGPETGTTTTDETDLFFVGTLPLNTNSTLQRKAFSVKASLGFVPPYSKVICKNETGAALASSGHAVKYATLTGESA